MAASDAKPIPIKNTAYRVTFPILDADGDLVTGAAGLDSEVSKDQGTFADCTNEATEIATSSGIYYLDLTSTEMNADTVAVCVKTSTSGAKTTTLILYPQESGDIKVDVQSYGGTAGTFSGGRPEVNASHWGGTAVASAVVGANMVQISGDATAADNLEAAADGTGFNLGGGSIVAASVTGAVGSVAGDVGGNVVGSVASVTAGVTISGTITTLDSLDSTLTSAHGSGNWTTATGFSTHSASDVWAVGTRELTSGAAPSVSDIWSAGTRTLTSSPGPSESTIAAAVWDESLSGHATAGTAGKALTDAGAAGDPWGTSLPGAYSAGTAGYIIGTNLNATISSRMATYTQPTGFLAATFPGTVASTTNITAGTITTVTNLTNLPTIPSNWLTAAGLASDAVTEIQSGLATASALSVVGSDVLTNGTVLSLMAGTGFDTSTDSLEAIRNRGDAAWTTATGFSTHSAADVWSVATRVLTAGTNIVLAKGVGVTGFNDLSAAQVNAEVDTALADYGGPTNAQMVAAFTEIKGSTWSTTDTLEAIRDRGDAAWITATGFSTHSAADVWAVGTRTITGGTITTYTGNTPQTGDAYAVVNSGTHGNAALKTLIDTVDAVVDSILADTGTDGVVLSSATQQSIATALLDLSNGVETSYTLRQALRLILSSAAAKLSGAATTSVVIRDIGDTKDRITATVDADGNRTAVSVDAT